MATGPFARLSGPLPWTSWTLTLVRRLFGFGQSFVTSESGPSGVGKRSVISVSTLTGRVAIGV
jgi:hypothetical protein